MSVKENKYTIMLVIAVLLITAFNVNKVNQIERLEEELKEDIVLNEEECWLMNLDDNGNGFNFPVRYCVQLKTICESSSHNIPCVWYDDFVNQSRCVCGWYQE